MDFGITLVKNEDIDRKRWDSAVSQTPYCSLFGYSWYLDNVCSTWDALIAKDYRHIMPIPVFEGRHQQMQQYLLWLGIYGSEIPSNEETEAFFNSIPENYNGLYLNLNKLCNISNVENGLIHHEKVYQIDLLQPYKNRKFQMPASLNKIYTVDVRQCASFFLINNYKTESMLYFNLIKEVKQRGNCMIFALANTDKIILGCAVVFISQTEIYLTDISVNKNQKDYKTIKNELLDTIINYFSGKNFTLYIKTNKRGVYDSYDAETLELFDAVPYPHIYYIRNNISKLFNFFNIK